MRSNYDDSDSKNSETTAARPNRAPHVSPETAERILGAAVKEFAEHGFTKTTIRGIASAAEVSPGLVIHHFGSKEGLRTACDDHVFDAIATAKAANAEYASRAMQMMFDDPSMAMNINYLMKSLLDPSEHGQRYFEHYLNLVEDYIAHGFAGYEFRQSEDPRGQAATIATLALAPTMLEHRLQESLGTNGLAETMTRLAPHLLDLYLNGVLEAVPDGADTGPVSYAARPDRADTDSEPTDSLGGDQS
ncbi:TetR/AcrR family transcriptional regulator [Brevibacterium sp. RIT 803]|uniref:TetR/AcrR family transcriptional regulator n=1 Tax=Brevibacterium sp. RIT 803 TaxID=2810210 RepID=UPI001951B10A|nr:TetR/AcrR family transcriptional regulator [Brevibacterium sp. RIT 803]MBM6589652.1 TetR/AcrR family transcriptional regulator [Brevibacterium sp. RIT 803]